MISKVKGSLLEALLSERNITHKLQDKIVIDRDPSTFHIMIEFIDNDFQFEIDIDQLLSPIEEKNEYINIKLFEELSYWTIISAYQINLVPIFYQIPNFGF